MEICMNFYKPEFLKLLYIKDDVCFCENFTDINHYNITRKLFNVNKNNISEAPNKFYLRLKKLTNMVDKNLIYSVYLRDYLRAVEKFELDIGRNVKWSIKD